MKVYLDMVGCRLNQAEIEELAANFHARGHEVCTDPEKADLIIVNTCCVTQKAGADSRKMIRKYQANPAAKLIATGCWTTLFKKEAFTQLADVSFVANPKKDEIPLLFPAVFAESNAGAGRPIDLGSRNRTRRFIKVQDGCDSLCAYCATRLARGKSRSSSLQSVIAPIKAVEAAGAMEAVLTGVQLGSWGKDIGLEIADLIQAILAETSIPRIRLSSIEPWDISERLIDLWADPRMMGHLHIPLQSGSDKTLSRMNRNISSLKFSDLLTMIRAKQADMAISTDIIVGFPGESEAEFEESFSFIEACQFSRGHVFQYSPMPFTTAAELPNQVSSTEKKARSKRLLAHFEAAQAAYNLAQIGQTRSVLFESHKKGRASGLTPDYQRVFVDTDQNLKNQILPVRLEKLESADAFLGSLLY